MGGTVAFFVFALVAVVAAWGVVTSKNIVHSAFFLALSFVGVAALYVMLNADFLAAVQLLVYTGAISIMVVFAVMLTLRGDVNESNPETKNWGWGALGATLVFVTLTMVIMTNPEWRLMPTPWTGTSSATDLSFLLLTQYVVPFEAAAVLLTVAMIGAIILAKGVSEDK